MWQAVKIIFFSGYTSLLLSCMHESTRPVPVGILVEDTMSTLLLEMHLYEGVAYQQEHMPSDSMKKLQAYFRQAILEKHQIPDSIYKQSLKYYVQHPVRLQRIYDRTLDSLDVLKSTYKPY